MINLLDFWNITFSLNDRYIYNNHFSVFSFKLGLTLDLHPIFNSSDIANKFVDGHFEYLFVRADNSFGLNHDLVDANFCLNLASPHIKNQNANHLQTLFRKMMKFENLEAKLKILRQNCFY